MSALFSPLRLRELELPNRIVISPMCQYSAIEGSAQDWHMIHLGQLAMSNAAMLMLEATAVDPRGRITPGCLGLYSDANEAALARVLRAIRDMSDIKIGIQLGHAGRKGSSREPWNGGALIPVSEGGWIPLAPSATRYSPTEPIPHGMSREELATLKEQFVAATRRADRLGFDSIEVHGGHGYLLHTFCSPLSNERTDEYGGSLEGRLRYPLEVFDAMRRVWPAGKPLGMRISSTDWVEGGFDIEQAIVYARELKALGADWVDCSSGGTSPQQKIPLGPGYQVHFAERIRRDVNVPTIAVGLITEPEQAEEIIASGRADMVALARGMLYNPRWPWHAAAKLGAQIKPPKQYGRSAPRATPNLYRDTTNIQR
jgi:2,4-dienoyl-CoA reductase-like NADH-dependent reductase (Old Yellow Enzyme family)